MVSYNALARDVYCIDALYIAADVASIYLLKRDDEVAIIETGTFRSMDNLLATMEALGIADSQVRYVIPTHVHLDHAGGASVMMQRFEQASLVIHPRGARHMLNPEKLIAAVVDLYGQEFFDRLYGRIEPIAEDRVIVAEDLDRLDLGSCKLNFIDTPGHARHHFCIYDETSNGMFTGDTFGLCYEPMKHLPRGLLPSCPPSQFDPPALRQSVCRIMDFSPDRLYLTHYGELPDPAAHLDSFNRWIDEYVALCESLAINREVDAAVLEERLMRLVLDGMSAGKDAADIAALLKIDIRLNAQGLAHWWGQQNHA